MPRATEALTSISLAGRLFLAMRWAVLALCVLAVEGLPADTIVIRARKVYPVSGPPIDHGQVLVRDGLIVEVGAQLSTRAGDARIVDVEGSIAPGLIDCGSDLGVLGRPAEEWSELTPETHVLDSIDFEHVELDHALREGVTSAAVSPGARNVIGGLGACVRTGASWLSAKDRVLARDCFLEVSLSDEASAGNFNLRFSRPITYTYRIPNTRMGTVFLARRAFFEALDQPDPERLSTMLSPSGKSRLREALGGKPIVRICADAEQEILSALRLAEEFKTRIQIVGGAECGGVVGRLAAAHVSVVLYPGTTFRDEDPEKYPQYTARLPALLAEAGVAFAFGSRDGDEVALLRSRAGMALRFGVTSERMLLALTLDAARLLGAQARIGSLERGKDADIVAFSGEPLDVSASVLWTMSAGRIDREMELEF